MPFLSEPLSVSGGDYLVLSGIQLIAGAVLLGFTLFLSLLLRLGLNRSLGIAALRMVAQLLLVGLVLDWIFSMENPWLILLMASVMACVAAWSAVGQTRRHFSGLYWNCLISILVSSFLVTGLALKGIFHLETWYSPQYLIPLLGMLLGNTLNGISLALDRFLDELHDQRDLVETFLSLGATSWEACHHLFRSSMRTGLIPTINSMAVMGIVSLPGMMTGQILAGVSPGEAVRYQIVIVFMITASVTLGTALVLLLAYRTMFSPRHQLMLYRLGRKNN